MAKIIPIDGGSFRLPSARDRITVVGPTGSGKTVAGLWHLSHATFDVRPYIIIDHKGDENLQQIDCPQVELGALPRKPGLYYCNPLATQTDAVDNYLMAVWAHENIGLYLDEGYMFDRDGGGLIACYTQGRSKRIPMITCSQRPTGISRFAFSEAQFFQVFPFTDKRETGTARNFAPIPDYYKGELLPEQWSWYFDVKRRKMHAMKPVSSPAQSLARIEARLQAMDEIKTEPRRRYI
jgi:hypothetical protein